MACGIKRHSDKPGQEWRARQSRDSVPGGKISLIALAFALSPLPACGERLEGLRQPPRAGFLALRGC